MRHAFAWTGGILFVVSLTAFAWFYGVTLGRPVESQAPFAWVAVAWNVGLFTAFAAHHSVMARTGAKRWLTRRIPPELERSVYVWVGSVLLLVVVAGWRAVPGVAWAMPDGWTWAGRAGQLAGAWFVVRGAGVIDALALAGVRQAAGDQRTGAFKVAGPFRFVRHPIYLGWVLMVWAVPLMTMSRLVMAGISTVYLLAAIPWEERSLTEAFGDVYREYQRRVRWRILPGVW